MGTRKEHAEAVLRNERYVHEALSHLRNLVGAGLCDKAQHALVNVAKEHGALTRDRVWAEDGGARKSNPAVVKAWDASANALREAQDLVARACPRRPH